ncbi:MAG: hypothetical protein CSA18_03730 [Deltaproteobacteria bacterium]|nr:MAG: hypothetical protein CSA18_03730 [Deltaproteobacteria bacterium]
MEFLPLKPGILNAIIWFAIVLIGIGIAKGIGCAGANYFIGGVLILFPTYFASILIIEGFSPKKH